MLTPEQKKRKAEYHKEWVRKNRLRNQEYQKKWKLEHPDAVRLHQHETHQKHKDKYKDKYKEKKKLWRDTHREYIAEHAREYRKTPNGRLSMAKAISKYAKNNPKRISAWHKASKIEFKPCIVCGEANRVHKHHPNIDKPLEVVMLCPLHHKQVHMLQ